MGRGEAGQREIADGSELVRTMAGEILGGEDAAAEAARKLLQPGREVHRRTDAGEIEPAGAADIAVEHLAQMKCEAESHRLGLEAGIAQGADLLPRFAR